MRVFRERDTVKPMRGRERPYMADQFHDQKDILKNCKIFDKFIVDVKIVFCKLPLYISCNNKHSLSCTTYRVYVGDCRLCRGVWEGGIFCTYSTSSNPPPFHSWLIYFGKYFSSRRAYKNRANESSYYFLQVPNFAVKEGG